MKATIGALLLTSLMAPSSQAQNEKVVAVAADASPVQPAIANGNYTIFNATPEQERALRAQIGQMRPEILPARVIFVPHWKYLDNTRVFQLHIPKGFESLMFTHLPSRTVFIDNDRYLGEDWLGYWMAHELGHLAKNSAREDDADKAAHEFRKRLKELRTTAK